MILKYENPYGIWNYIDEISQCKVDKDYSHHSCSSEDAKNHSETYPIIDEDTSNQKEIGFNTSEICILKNSNPYGRIIVGRCAFLMNDKGQTIERLN